MSTLPITTDPAATYQVVAVAEPAATGWLHLPSLHAKLLSLALAAGHTRLVLSCDYEGDDDFRCTYSAHAGGGDSGFRSYITPFDLNGGHLPDSFERVLTGLLEQQVTYLQAMKGGQPDA
jgi:hypothetical protein